MSDKLNDDIVIEGSAVQDNSYNIEESNSLGKVQIADDVVAIIAGLAAGEVEGVYRLTGNLPNELASKFKEDNGSIICRELLGFQKNNKESYVPSERTNEYYKKRPCPELCKYAADILEEYLKKENLI